jgi:hypothetical protein
MPKICYTVNRNHMQGANEGPETVSTYMAERTHARGSFPASRQTQFRQPRPVRVFQVQNEAEKWKVQEERQFKTLTKGENTMKLKEKFERKGELVGIDEISDFTGRSTSELMRLRAHFGFPLVRDGRKIWHADKRAIKDWESEQRALQKTTGRPLPPEFDVTLHGIERISEFFKEQCHTLMNWPRQHKDCPIQRDETGVYSVVASELQRWLEARGLRVGPHLRPGRKSMREGGASRW